MPITLPDYRGCSDYIHGGLRRKQCRPPPTVVGGGEVACLQAMLVNEEGVRP